MSNDMRNATSVFLFGASSLVLSVVGCGGGADGSRDDAKGGSATSSAGTSPIGGSASGGSGGGAACVVPAGKKGDGSSQVIDEIDDTNTMFAPAGVGSGSWDFSKDASKGTITPPGTVALMPVDGGHAGSALHVQGSALTGWGASLAAFLNGPMGSFDASAYGGVAFWIKGTTTVLEGTDKVMIQARMPDVLPGPGSCCNDDILGAECYSGHRVVISITSDWQEVKIDWAQFKGPAWGLGLTLPFNPERVRDINFSFNHDTAKTTDAGASFDVWVDGVRFMTKGEMGNVMPGGSGGSSSGGSSSGGSASGGSASGGSSSGGSGGSSSGGSGGSSSGGSGGSGGGSGGAGGSGGSSN